MRVPPRTCSAAYRSPRGWVRRCASSRPPSRRAPWSRWAPAPASRACGCCAACVLTSIDVDPEHQRIARAAFVASGHGASRLRLINGMGLEVLPRLTDGGYDLVLVDASPTDHPRYLDEALRLLR